MRTHQLTIVMLAVTASAGCVGDVVEDPGDDVGGDAGVDPPVCEVTRSYPGFGGRMLEATRPSLAAGADRMRQKPFIALATEYTRALSLASFDTAAYAATFGRPPARWFGEPNASANTIYAAFALAYAACTQQTATDATYAAAPTMTTATLACHDYVERAWHRSATDEETAACVSFAIDKTASVANPRTRWAYTCATVLSAAGFLAY